MQTDATCWPETPNVVGWYMLRPFAHPVHLRKQSKIGYNIIPVACCCAKFETGETLSYVQRDGPTMLGVVAPVCTLRSTLLAQDFNLNHITKGIQSLRSMVR